MIATYRLQLNKDFTFKDAEDRLDYFADLGISHLYLSPINTAPPESTHNYDVWNYQEINPVLGGRAGFESLVAKAHERGIGIVVDFVPNHMGIAGTGNKWWQDVLKFGPKSKYAEFFDICWPDGKVRLPVLGDSLDNILKRGEIKIEGDELVYFEHRWPISPGTLVKDDPAATLAKQHYEPIFWREGPKRINYRRFFEVNTLAGVAVEKENVFKEVHSLVLDLVNSGKVDGLRIDHIDGLADPNGYLKRLHEGCQKNIWLLVEKILAPEEKLPDEWPTDGTTGYDFLFYLNNLFVPQKNEAAFTRIYSEVTRENRSFAEIARESKREVLHKLFKAEFDSLLRATNRTREDVEEQILSMSVYRTYEHGDKFQTKLQQLTGPVMAKGVEDTAFYRYHRFIGLNEVGGDPGIFGISPAQFHEQCKCRAEEMPYSMLTTSTHDTKFSEDVRARLAVLTEIPQKWEESVLYWMKMLPGPDANTQYRFFQALVGTWPGDGNPADLTPEYFKRIYAFMMKSVREAKVDTSWLDPNESWEKSLNDYIRAVLEGNEGAPIRDSVSGLVKKIAPYGERNSLAQVLLKLSCPGVPDIYQGQEIWDFNLVDPDNRRRIDWSRRQSPAEKDGAIKLRLTKSVLEFRAHHPELFTEGEYSPVDVDGPHADHCIAFQRSYNEHRCIVAVPRLMWGVQDWGDTTLDLPTDIAFKNLFTGHPANSSALRDIFAEFPVALLVEENA